MNKNALTPEEFTKLVFSKPKDGLANSLWIACNEPSFEACFDFEVPMLMERGMNIVELAKWIEMMLRKAQEGAEL